MADLGQGYLDVGHYHEAVELYQDLLRRDRGQRSCEYQGHVTEAVLALKTGDKVGRQGRAPTGSSSSRRAFAPRRTPTT